MDAITHFFDFIQNWLDSGIYTFFTKAVATVIEHLTLAYLAFMAKAIPFAWGVAKQILQDINISSYINDAWGQLPPASQAIATAMKVPEIVNTVLSGYATKFVLRFIPGV